MSKENVFPVGSAVRDNGTGFPGLIPKDTVGFVVDHESIFIRVRFEFLRVREAKIPGHQTPGELLYRDDELELV